MDTSFTIRLLNNSHCQQIIDLILPIQQIEFNEPVTINDQPDLLDIDSNYYKTGGCFWGIIRNGEVIGTIALIANGHQTGTIRKMFVKKEFRGKESGLAQQLMETLKAYCAKHQICHLYLGTADFLKAACRFYERNGFQVTAPADLPTYFPRMEIDNLFYYLKLC
ncbi:MAG: GCN5-related N-acetyltransferase [Mucilaginibacter sp.]|nr:GCN5-related N-acetyltransferase [Mucilaginibacter sp.]